MNGHSTLTDDHTGLMWEAESNDASIHDKRVIYTWASTISVHITGLKTRAGFARTSIMGAGYSRRG